MTCEQALELISGHIDRENTPDEETLLQAHLLKCESCRGVLQAFLDLESGLKQLEEPPADLRENVMAAVRAEAPVPKKKKAKRWGGLAVAAALVAVIGISAVGLHAGESAPAEAAAPMMARSMTEPAAMDVADVDLEAMEISPQALADERQADVAVTYDLLLEMEVCSCETLDSGALLYLLETADAAVELSRLYGVELYQPASYTGSCSYALLLPRN